MMEILLVVSDFLVEIAIILLSIALLIHNKKGK